MNEEEQEVKNGEEGNIEETGKIGTQANTNKDEGKKGKAEKTYTQEEYNALDKKLKAKYEKKYEGIDINKYKEWIESQKTEDQKQTEKEVEYQKTLSRNIELENENKVFKAGVEKENVDFVAYKVSKMEGDFDANLIDFLKENPRYLGTEEPKIIKRVGSSLNLSGRPNINQNDANQVMNDLIRSARD